jgi:hypothetical protein
VRRKSSVGVGGERPREYVLAGLDGLQLEVGEQSGQGIDRHEEPAEMGREPVERCYQWRERS